MTPEPGNAEESFLTVAEVAELLKLNQQTVRNWIDQGSLPALRVGRRVRIRRSDFDRLLEEGSTSGSRGRRTTRAERRGLLGRRAGGLAERPNGGRPPA